MNTLKRWLRHMWLDAADARRLITHQGLQRLEVLVQQSESRHRGELRLCVEAGLPWADVWAGLSPRQRAVELFGSLRVWDTEHNNGVLIYLLLAERRIEILADRGLSQHVPDTVWAEMVEKLKPHLQAGRFEQGLAQSVDQVGQLLRAHYPLAHHPHGKQADNPNELPDAVVVL